MDGEGQAAYQPGSHARRPSGRPFSRAAGSGTHVVPEKKAKKVAAGTRKSSRNQASDDDADSSPEDEEEEEYSLPEGGEKKRKASPIGEAEGSKRGRTIPPDSFANTSVGEDEWPPRARRPVRS